MRYRYLAIDPEALAREAGLEQLESLYEQLLLKANGSVEEALDWLEQIADRYRLWPPGMDRKGFTEWLQRRGLVHVPDQKGLALTGRGEQALREHALRSIFSDLQPGAAGSHRTPHTGRGRERLPETRPFQPGDAMQDLAAVPSLRNALTRGLPGPSGLRLEERDLEVYETEHDTSCATVLLIDVSHSMILYGEDRITPAKQLALALAEYIRTNHPKDRLEVVLFGDDAWQVPLDRIPYCGVGPFHTNTRAGLRLAMDLLRRCRQPNRQILMITDGKPSALTESDGRLYKNPFGLDPRIVNKTLEAADECRRAGIPISTFMLTDEPSLVAFVEEFTRAARGRAWHSGVDGLGSAVFVDYVRGRRGRVS
ncbi:MAG: hypothetical protein R3E96_07920 [Planctomycetota bacterium]